MSVCNDHYHQHRLGVQCVNMNWGENRWCLHVMASIVNIGLVVQYVNAWMKEKEADVYVWQYCQHRLSGQYILELKRQWVVSEGDGESYHPWLRVNIKGFWPDWYIVTMTYSGDIPFWSETLELCKYIDRGESHWCLSVIVTGSRLGSQYACTWMVERLLCVCM